MDTTNNNLLISVIVPIYGVEKYLDTCIKSLLAQTYTHLEIILVNDGSKDRCPEICDDYKNKDNRISVIHKQNGGIVSARKAGLEVARGEYIGYVDGDDWVEPEMFEDMISYVMKYNVDIVASGHKEELAGHCVEVLKNNISSGFYTKEDMIEKVYPKMLNNGKFSQFGLYSYLWNKIFRKDILYKNQMLVDNRISMAEDAACTYPTLLDANSLYISESNYYHYRQRVDSMVKQRTPAMIEIEKYDILYQYLKDRFQTSEHIATLLPQLDLFLLSLLTVRSDLSFSENELYPFGDIPYGSDIIICGAGTFGQHLYNRLSLSDNYKVTGWIDDLFQYYNHLNLNVDDLTIIGGLKYDFVLVAFIDETVADGMVKKLVNLGVPIERIFRITHYYKHNIKDLLRGFGLNV